MTKPGRFTYMSTRNNNFSNRSQKGFISVGARAAKQEPLRPGMVSKTAPNPEFVAFTGTLFYFVGAGPSAGAEVPCRSAGT